MHTWKSFFTVNGPDWMEEEEITEYVSSLKIESCAIDDPGDLQRFEDRVRGLPLHDDFFSGENEYGTRRFEITVELDDDDRILGVTDVQSEGLESESANSSSWASCYPDYDWIARAIERRRRRV